jgi:GNAT superfamily N-acetyltransferase
VDLSPVELLRPATDPRLAAELLALQVAAYRVEAALIGSDAIPALHETTATLVAAGLSWIGCRDGEGLLGAAASTETSEIIELDRLVVAPRAFRRGIGGRLLAAVVELAEHRSVVVSTGRDTRLRSVPRPQATQPRAPARAPVTGRAPLASGNRGGASVPRAG